MSTVEKGAILEKCLNTLSLFVACKDRRHFATLPDWFPGEKTSKERPQKFHTDDLPLSQTTSSPPFFSQGQQSERNASARENHPTRERRYAWGDFDARSRFVRSTIPEEKWGTTRSLPLSRSWYCTVDLGCDRKPEVGWRNVSCFLRQ